MSEHAVIEVTYTLTFIVTLTVAIYFLMGSLIRLAFFGGQRAKNAIRRREADKYWREGERIH